VQRRVGFGNTEQVFARLQGAHEERPGAYKAARMRYGSSGSRVYVGTGRGRFMDDANLCGLRPIGDAQVGGGGTAYGNQARGAQHGVAGAGIKIEALLARMRFGQVQVAQIVHCDNAGGQRAGRRQWQHMRGYKEDVGMIAVHGRAQAAVRPCARRRQHARGDGNVGGAAFQQG